MENVSIKQLYDDWAADYEQAISSIEWAAPRRVLEHTRPFLPDNAKVLELGIGTGYLAALFAQSCSGFTLYGTDLSGSMLDICSQKNIAPRDNLFLHDLEREDLPLQDHHVDLVISCGVLEYVEDLSKATQEIARVLKRGGRFALCYEAPEDATGTRTLLRRGIRDSNNQNICFFYYHHGRDKMAALLENAGLKISGFENFHSVKAAQDGIPYTLVYGYK